jgi:CHAT domain
MIDLRRRAAEQFDQVVAEIRSKPGFAAFLLPVPIRELLPVARHETFALLNVTDIRSDALLLTSDGVQVVPLAEVTPGAVEHRAVQALSMLEVAQDALSGPELRNWAEAEFSRILGWLWDTIAGPVLERLGIAALPGGTASPTVAASAAVAEAEALWRLWWCPSGLLTLLPLHAAGHHTTRFDDAPATVLDRVVSSYTPTLRALSQSRRSTRKRSDRTAETPMRYVLVAMPHTPGKPDLPGTVDEANLLRGWFPDAFSVLHGVLRPEEAAHLGLERTSGLQPDATHERVLAALSGSAWAHFACHAVSDIRNPSASHLLLADYQTHPLTVLDLTGLHLDNADLAYLSACATASTGPHLADESIQLAAALQLAGYRHVIATLWPIADRTAVRVAKDVYSAIADGGVDAAPMALHRSIRRRRNLNPDLPSTWAAHIHTGA